MNWVLNVKSSDANKIKPSKDLQTDLVSEGLRDLASRQTNYRNIQTAGSVVTSKKFRYRRELKKF